jgi:transposase
MFESVATQRFAGSGHRIGPISKQGDQYLRRILIVGAIAVLRRALQNPGKYPWLTQLLARRPLKVVAVALANKMARTAGALVQEAIRAATMVVIPVRPGFFDLAASALLNGYEWVFIDTARPRMGST